MRYALHILIDEFSRQSVGGKNVIEISGFADVQFIDRGGYQLADLQERDLSVTEQAVGDFIRAVSDSGIQPALLHGALARGKALECLVICRIKGHL